MLNKLVKKIIVELGKLQKVGGFFSVWGAFASVCDFSFWKEGALQIILYYFKILSNFVNFLKATVLGDIKQFWKYWDNCEFSQLYIYISYIFSLKTKYAQVY